MRFNEGAQYPIDLRSKAIPKHMKIIFISEKYANVVGGGAEKSLRILAEGVSSLGHEAVVVTPTVGKVSVYREGGVKTCELPMNTSRWPFDSRATSTGRTSIFESERNFDASLQLHLSELLRQERPNVVHTNNLFGFSSRAWETIARQGIPTVHTLRDYYLTCPRSNRFRVKATCKRTCLLCRPFEWLNRRRTELVQAVVGNSQFILNHHLNRNFFRKAHLKAVIYNGTQSVPRNSRRDGAPKPFRFGFLGRLVPEKGIEEALRVFCSAPLNEHQFKVAGDLDSVYAKTLARKFSRANITFVGWTNAHELYRSVDVIIVPSLWNEPLPRVIFEAYQYGLPVVAASRGGISEIVRAGETGLLYNPDSPAGLSDCVLRFVRGEVDYMNLHIQCLVAGRQFTIGRLVEGYLSIYRELSSGREPHSSDQDILRLVQSREKLKCPAF